MLDFQSVGILSMAVVLVAIINHQDILKYIQHGQMLRYSNSGHDTKIEETLEIKSIKSGSIQYGDECQISVNRHYKMTDPTIDRNASCQPLPVLSDITPHQFARDFLDQGQAFIIRNTTLAAHPDIVKLTELSIAYLKEQDRVGYRLFETQEFNVDKETLTYHPLCFPDHSPLIRGLYMGHSAGVAQHVDWKACSVAWQYQLVGSKSWRFLSPLDDKTMFCGDIHPGEVLVYFPQWFHTTDGSPNMFTSALQGHFWPSVMNSWAVKRGEEWPVTEGGFFTRFWLACVEGPEGDLKQMQEWQQCARAWFSESSIITYE